MAAAEPLKVLIFEDDSIISLYTAGLLQDLGHTAVEATSAEDALAMLAANPDFDLVIADYRLPSLSGGGLATAIQATWPGIQVVMLSGYTNCPSDVPDRVPWLTKPLSPHHLEHLLDEVYQHRRRRLA
jgi:CheY-like chemotaxis protein